MITGASGGFGREMIRQFLSAGSRLILSDRDQETVQQACAEIGADTANILAIIAADLSDSAGCNALLDEVAALGVCPDILINNAGIGVGGRMDLVPQERWEQVLQINLLAPMRLCHRLLPQMLARGSGHVVNISSIAGWVGPKGLASYSASKFGLRGFSESLRNDVSSSGVAVSAVFPWFSRTPILESETFGPQNALAVPEDMVTEPADIVEQIVHGVRNNVAEIFPDKMARRIHFMKRHFPGLMVFVQRRMEAKVTVETSELKDT